MPEEITPDSITKWAIEYANFEDLEVTAKAALYGIYAQQRKELYPNEHRTAKQNKKKYYKKHFTN